MSDPIGHQPLKPYTGLLPGTYLFFDSQPCEEVEDDCGLLVRLRHDDTKEGGTLIATVCHPELEDEGVEMDPYAMVGRFERIAG